MRRTIGWMGAGLGIGVLWGIAIRAWMRLISDEPEFTLSGTLFIVGAAGVVGLGFGMALSARQAAWRGRQVPRVAGAMTVVFLGLGAGSITLPTIVLGGFALGRPPARLVGRILLAVGALAVGGLAGTQDGVPWIVFPIVAATVAGVLHPRTSRMAVGLLAIAPIVMVAGIVLDARLPLWRQLLGIVLYVALLTPITLAFSRIVAPTTRPTAPAPTTEPHLVAGSW